MIKQFVGDKMVMKKTSQFLILVVTSIFFISACSQESEQSSDIISVAVASLDRLEDDYARDIDRKPAEVLRFFGVEPGMTVIDVFSGGGYYTEILDDIVGEDGKVIAHNNQGYKNFARDELEKRYENDRLSNTFQYWAEANELGFEKESADLVMVVLGMHDVYYKPEDQNWPTIDEDKFYNDVIAAMKPGGVLGVVDHRAVSGAEKTTGHSLHRIDPYIIINALTERGLVLEAETDILANDEDNLTIPMWDPEIRGKTDRFVLRFRKPVGDNGQQGVLNAPWRGDEDKTRDAARKPEEVLTFFDVSVGQTVLDMVSGGGYYTQILSAVVGDEGRVVAHNTTRTPEERSAELSSFYQGLGNVDYIVSDMSEFPLADNSVDRVLLFLIYHHLHQADDSGEALPASSAAVLAEVRRVLRPDGVFGVIEHRALDGASRAESAPWHRVPSEMAIADMEANGFTFVKQSDLFSGFADPMNCDWHECVERGATNRLVHYYQPKE